LWYSFQSSSTILPFPSTSAFAVSVDVPVISDGEKSIIPVEVFSLPFSLPIPFLPGVIGRAHLMTPSSIRYITLGFLSGSIIHIVSPAFRFFSLLLLSFNHVWVTISLYILATRFPCSPSSASSIFFVPSSAVFFALSSAIVSLFASASSFCCASVSIVPVSGQGIVFGSTVVSTVVLSPVVGTGFSLGVVLVLSLAFLVFSAHEDVADHPGVPSSSDVLVVVVVQGSLSGSVLVVLVVLDVVVLEVELVCSLLGCPVGIG
jgi:hypothetical protein